MSNINGVFITGTDTDVGKTFVSTVILRALVKGGVSVVGLKPIASGFELRDGEWRNADVDALTSASNVVLAKERINRYAFKPAIAPHIAAIESNEFLDFNAIKQDVDYAAEHANFVLVEGVGGWHVPLSDPKQSPIQDIQSLAQHLTLPIIMVVGLRLGCLNHALLTANAIGRSGLQLIGWVANHIEPDFDHVNDNIFALEQQLSVPRLFDIPYMSNGVQVALDGIENSDYIEGVLRKTDER